MWRAVLLPWLRTTRRYVDPRMPPLELVHTGQQTLQQIHRLKTGDHDRYTEIRGDRFILVSSHHRTDMPCCQETLHLHLGRTHDGLQRRRHPHMSSDDRKVLQSELRRLQHRQRAARGGSFESHSKQHHLTFGMLLRQVYRFYG
jgi:hypothetical protein